VNTVADFKTVDTSGFDAALAAFAKALETYSDCRDKFERQSKTLLGKWEGVARDSYKTSYDNIQRSLTDNLDSLKYIMEILSPSARPITIGTLKPKRRSRILDERRLYTWV